MSSYIPALPPRAHQIEGLEKASGRPGFMWLMEMGTGKTKTDLDETGRMAHDGEIDACLMLAPKGVYTNWLTDEIPKHWLPDFRDEWAMGTWRGGGTVANRAEINSMFAQDGRRKFMFMNIEAIAASDKAFNVAFEFVRRNAGRVKISIDESTVIKSHNSVRKKAVDRLKGYAAVRRCLSGQPVPNGPLDIWAQADFAAPGHLGSSFYGFRSRYAVMQKKQFDPTKKPVDVVVGYRDIPELRDRIRLISFRKTKAECLDLPPKVYLPFRHVELTDEQRRIYREMVDNAIAEIDIVLKEQGPIASAQLALVRMLRLQQIVCGHVVDNEKNVHRLKTNRPAALLEATEEVRGAGIVWANFQDDLDRVTEVLERAYPGKVVAYHGRVSQEQRDIGKKRFQDGSADWFVGSPSAGGRGITLLRGVNTIYYSNSHNLDHRDQSEDRPHRDGQTSTCAYQDLVATDTFEAKVVDALRKKIDLSTAVMGDSFRHWVI